jgi:hypothetical protein
MKLIVVLILFFTQAFSIEQCPGCDKNCWRNNNNGQYQCVDLSNFNSVVDFGTLRKCRTPTVSGCFGSGGRNIQNPSQCCSGVAKTQGGKNRMYLMCLGSDICDKSDGCGADINCRYNEYCIDHKCVIEQENVNCGSCNKLPIRGKCCGSGITHEGICTCATGKCGSNVDCQYKNGKYYRDYVCCPDGRCGVVDKC